jgi:FKBP-type peptidyl-prolyl cis-trans isomerase SlyD
MIVEEQNVVTIAYELRDGGPSGELMERMDVNWPFKFLFGTGKLLPAFEEQLRGLSEDDTFEFVLKSEEAYGKVEAGNIIDVPMKAFEVDGVIPPNLIVENTFVSLVDDTGESHQGKILSYTDTHVKVDFNHAMAGKQLHFKGVVLDIRKATVDELIRKHYIQEDGIHRPDFGEN